MLEKVKEQKKILCGERQPHQISRNIGKESQIIISNNINTPETITVSNYESMKRVAER